MFRHVQTMSSIVEPQLVICNNCELFERMFLITSLGKQGQHLCTSVNYVKLVSVMFKLVQTILAGGSFFAQPNLNLHA